VDVLTPENEITTLSQNVRLQSPTDAVPHLRMMETSTLHVILILTQVHLKLLVCYNLYVHFAVSIIFVMLELFFVSVSSQKLSPS